METKPPHRRHLLRLPGYDYSQNGAYFITIVTQGRRYLFGEVVNGEMVSNEVGRMVEQVWLEIPAHFRCVNADTFIIMPNHIHGIIVIEQDDRPPNVGATHESPLHDIPPLHHEPPLPHYANGPKPGSIGAIVGLFKATVSKRYHTMTHIPNTPLWQRNYYEHIIRNEQDHLAIYDYIFANPMNWEKDEEFTL